MNSRTAAFILSLGVSSGCGSRTALDDTTTCLDDACDEPRVEDCKRIAPEATPLAIVRGDAPSLLIRDGALYFRSEHRVQRLPLDTGRATPLTPAARSSVTFDVRDGTVVWMDDDDLEIKAMSTAGGEPRTVAEAPMAKPTMVIAGDRVVLSYGAATLSPGPVYSVPLAGGTPVQIGVTAAYVERLDERDGQVLFGTAKGLISMDPMSGITGDLFQGLDPNDPNDTFPAWELASTSDGMAAVSWAIEFVGMSTGQQEIYLSSGVAKPIPLVRGLFEAVAVDEEDVAFDGIAGDPRPGHSKIGVIARSGGEPVYLAESDTTFNDPAPARGFINAIASDGNFIYWPQLCLDRDELRLVRMAKR